MKIVRIIARLNVGGPARHVVWLTSALNAGEHRSVLITGTVPEGEEDMGYFAAEHRVEPVFIEEMSRELSPKDAVSLWKVFRQLVRERPDVIHTHTAKAGTVGRVAAFLYRWLMWKRVRVVHTFHGHVFHSYYGKLKTSVFLAIERTLARLATDRIVVISERQRREICDNFRVGRPEQFVVIPLGIDLEPFSDPESRRSTMRAEFGIADDEVLVGFVGRLTEIKNIGMFIEAAARLADRPKIRFVIIGDGHLRSGLESQAQALGLAENLIFAGNRDDSAVFYAALDVVALCSLNEGTPLTLIEAMANGKPFVSTAVGGVPDLAGAESAVKDGFSICERGLLVASGDVAGFAGAIAEIAEDSELRRRLGDRGKSFVNLSYSRERLVSDICELYHELKSPNGGSA